MSIIEVTGGRVELTFRQRWSHYLALAFGVIGLLIGLNLRESFLSTTTVYTNLQAGITAEYPQNWLLEEGSGRDFIFRVRAISERGYNTTIQVAARPISADTTARNIFDVLTLERAQTLAAYNVIAEEPYTLPDGTIATSMIYTFVATDPNPFLQSIPIGVEGIDILLIERGQAIIVSFLSDAATFDKNAPVLNRFLRSLDF